MFSKKLSQKTRLQHTILRGANLNTKNQPAYFLLIGVKFATEFHKNKLPILLLHKQNDILKHKKYF